MRQLKFRPTQEQERIFEASAAGGTLVVNAVAGSGKTASIEADATLNPRHSLYLVYNAANRKEAQGRMPRHVTPMTGHSLAFRPMIANNDDLRRKFESARNGSRISPWDIQDALDVRSDFGIPAMQLSGHILKTVSGFQNSADREIRPHHVATNALPANLFLPDKADKLASLKDYLTAQASRLWERMSNPKDNFGLLHDTYLKMYGLNNPTLNYDLIYCDEFQDANPVLADIVRQQEHAQKIYIGDRYQAIYSWRGAEDALKHALNDGAELLNLSRSFRFGKHVAAMANTILNHLEADTEVRGAGPAMRPFDEKLQTAVVARNNMTLFEHAVEAIESKTTFTIVGGAREMVKLIESGYALYANQHDKVQDEDLRRYQSWDEFKSIAEIMGDTVSTRLIKFIEQYKARSLDYIEDLKNSDNTPEEVAQKVLTTAHKSKGREFNQTFVCDDLAIEDELLNISTNDPGLLKTEQREQFNLLYVAITRCQEAMKFSPALKHSMQSMFDHNRAKKATKATQQLNEAVASSPAPSP